MDIFEGTEQIQQLVISRAISGLRIESLIWANAPLCPPPDVFGPLRRAKASS